mmetsp:Transcript_81943/g.240551  ORF Transcript_81943/g.240551 Transcript_81943/m.240551 type:complete len:397 (+) Transcript_81943:32-1222(+)
MVEVTKSQSPHDECECKQRPVPVGRAWIHGHFTGIVATSSHCMDVAVPIQHEVPISAILPALAALREASETECEGVASEHTPSSHHGTPKRTERLSKKLWEELLAIFSAETGDCHPDSHPAAPEGTAEAAREVEAEAKEALLQEVIDQRNNLINENEAIKEELNTGPLSRFVRRGSITLLHGVQEAMGLHSSDDRTGPAASRAQSSRRPSAGGPEDAKEEEEEAVEEEAVEDGPQVKVNGHFSGHVRLPKHHLEVNLPVRGRIPGRAALDIARALAGPALDIRHLSQPLHSPHYGQNKARNPSLPKIWDRLSRLLAAELPEQARRRSRRPTGTPAPGAPANTQEEQSERAEPCPMSSSTGRGPENSRMVLVDIVELEEKMQELERLALQLTSLRPS